MEDSSKHVTDLRSGTEGSDTQQTTTEVSDKKHKTSEKDEGGSVWSTIIETVRYALIAVIIILPIRYFIAQPFVVSGNSMFPTFKDGEYLIVDELSKYIGEYHRGDVVILRYPNDPSKYFIKRVIGLPGETVSINDGVVSITSPTQTSPLLLNEAYVKNPKIDHATRTLDDSEYFVMGDNRAQSSDSRIWGPVPKRLMDGKALLRLYPISRIMLHPGNPQSFNANY